MKRIYTTFVTLFWFTMMALLFQKEVLPNLIITSPMGYKIELTEDTPIRESWMGIYFKDKKIGFSNTVIRQDVDDGIAGYRIDEVAMLRLNMLGEPDSIKIKGGSFFTENQRLKNFNYTLTSSGYRLDVTGEAKGSNLNVAVDIGGERIEKVFKIKQNTLISNSISPILLFKQLDKDKEIDFEILDPVSFGMKKLSIKKIGRVGKTNIFETDIAGIKTKTWITEDGDVVKEESMLGFTMHKETMDEALRIGGSMEGVAPDLVSGFSIPAGVEILNPREVSYLKIAKNKEIVEIFRDKEFLKKDILSIPIEEDIPEEDFVQSKDERIKKLAGEIIGDEKDSWIASKKILNWVYENVRKAPTLSVPSSLDVLRTLQGDCNEHTVLFTALTRSVGIPTIMVAGLVYLEGTFYYHAWPKVYVGEWVNMDPTLGQEIADATHIPLLEGGLKEQLELVRIIGDLEIEVIEYKVAGNR